MSGGFPSNEPHHDEIEVDADAAAALRSWQFLVRAMPHLVGVKERRVPLLSLMYWYKRVFEDDGFAGGPPIEGLDALCDELAAVSVPHKLHTELARARWAVRLAEELVSWRQLLQAHGTGSVALGRATDELEQVLAEANRHIGVSSAAQRGPLQTLSERGNGGLLGGDLVPCADEHDQRTQAEVDLRFRHAHDGERPEADVLEQEVPLGSVIAAEVEALVDDQRIEPVDEADGFDEGIEP